MCLGGKLSENVSKYINKWIYSIQERAVGMLYMFPLSIEQELKRLWKEERGEYSWKREAGIACPVYCLLLFYSSVLVSQDLTPGRD